MAINNFTEQDWINGTNQGYDDPTQWNGTNPSCKLCDKEAEAHDEYCEDHQRCIVCGDNDYCDCEEELSQISACCEYTMDTDRKICYKCKDHCSSSWEEAVEMCRK